MFSPPLRFPSHFFISPHPTPHRKLTRRVSFDLSLNRCHVFLAAPHRRLHKVARRHEGSQWEYSCSSLTLSASSISSSSSSSISSSSSASGGLPLSPLSLSPPPCERWNGGEGEVAVLGSDACECGVDHDHDHDHSNSVAAKVVESNNETSIDNIDNGNDDQDVLARPSPLPSPDKRPLKSSLSSKSRKHHHHHHHHHNHHHNDNSHNNNNNSQRRGVVSGNTCTLSSPSRWRATVLEVTALGVLIVSCVWGLWWQGSL